MKLRWVIALSALSLQAQQLSVRSATAHHVELSWSGAAGVTVERKSAAGQFEKLGDASSAFTDDKILPYATYRYRVRTASGATSNEVTVGPPPSGLNVAARLPKDSDPGKFGTNTSLALDENGDPAIAFLWADPNNDNDYTDSGVYFVRWSRASYRWKPIVNVAVVGETPSQSREPVSLACDRASGAFAVSYPKNATQGATVSVSRDGGATWTATPVGADMDGALSSTSIAAAGGRWHLALISDQAGVRYLTGAVADAPSAWKSKSAPSPASGRIQASGNVVLATDAAGKALIGYWVLPEEGSNFRVMLWNPESGEVSQAMDSGGQACDTPDLRLNIGGGKTRLLVNCARDPKDTDFGIWYTATSGGAWSAPVKLPVDGPRTTNAPLALAVDSKGRIAAAYGSNGGSAGTACGFPVLALSTDGVKWTACGPGKRVGADFEPQPSTVSATVTPDDRLNLVWHQAGENKYGMGILLWRE